MIRLSPVRFGNEQHINQSDRSVFFIQNAIKIKMVTVDCFFIDKLNNHFICQKTIIFFFNFGKKRNEIYSKAHVKHGVFIYETTTFLSPAFIFIIIIFTFSSNRMRKMKRNRSREQQEHKCISVVNMECNQYHIYWWECEINILECTIFFHYERALISFKWQTKNRSF